MTRDGIGDEVTGDTFDVAVIGAGVVGCAIARRLTLEGARVVVLEKADEVLDGASKGNSAILHTGFDAPPGSLEARCLAEGYLEYRAIHQRLGLPLDSCGALVIAWEAEEEERLPELLAKAEENGVGDVALLSAAETRALEPGLAPHARASLMVPGEAIIDAWSAPHAYMLQALSNGARLLRSCEVTAGAFDGARWELATSRGKVLARATVNAAGLYGDIVEARLIGHADFVIRPRRGEFVVYDKSAVSLARHILLPVPTETTKGVVVCRTAWGNLLVGPTAQEQKDRASAPVGAETLALLRRRGETILPDLARHEVTAVYAGLRPASEERGYRVRAERQRRYVAVGGIRSTGLSSALGLARHVSRLCDGFWDAAPALDEPAWPQMPNISEGAARDWQRPGNGGIVCHCELVTRREIDRALEGPLAATTLAGLKRRTRVMMGRCQGFYCAAELAELTRGRLRDPQPRPQPVDAA